jgi:hypothetical protein
MALQTDQFDGGARYWREADRRASARSRLATYEDQERYKMELQIDTAREFARHDDAFYDALRAKRDLALAVRFARAE